MTLQKIQDNYKQHPHFTKIVGELNQSGTKHILLKGLHGSSESILLSGIFQDIPSKALLIFPDKEAAAYVFNDLKTSIPEKKVQFFPSSYKRSLVKHFTDRLDQSGLILRTEALNNIAENKGDYILVSYPEAIIEKVISKEDLHSNTLRLKVGEGISIEFITEVLIEYGFQRVDFVYEPGQYSVRGSIVDVFSFSNDYPYRIDFFGEEVDTIRTFDVVSQLSKATLNEISILPDIQTENADQKRISFLDYLPEDVILVSTDFTFLSEKIDLLWQKSEEEHLEENSEINLQQFLVEPELFKNQLQQHSSIEINSHSFYKTHKSFDFNTLPQPEFRKNFRFLYEFLHEKSQDYYEIFFLSENEKQFDRLTAIFESEEFEGDIQFQSVHSILSAGFIDQDLKIIVLTDHQVFERYHKFRISEHEHTNAQATLSIKELNSLQPGDYVVHVDHGIGKFGGLQKVEQDGKQQECIRLIYKDQDVLFVSIHSLHRISKYRGKDTSDPKIHKLGSGVWQRQKKKTKSKVKDIAKELINLYAKRKTEKGFAFTADSYLQHELESSFIFEDTPDQVKSTVDVKKDMEQDVPMDRLICGDVGFGKTEIAVRAAFKAVADSKQVAVLVPTTILTLQHYKTFSKRLADFPCTIDYISRLRTAKTQRETIKKLKEGKIDILIGTHRLIGKDVSFKDLGLLIIDEEQKFGVSVKEKLKALKLNVDTLTLTATPIPRTLQFSLMGARDLSVINTPPPNRYPIITEIHTFNEDVIREAINYEIERNGQVFFIHNRIQNIDEVQALIHRMCPDVKTAVAHGQMDGPVLEKIMLDFINEEYGVLIATTIIESGLDIPNVNTIIINNAHNFGLSDLHQLRGRVGRSDKKAFAYLLAPPVSGLTPEARRRLRAIEMFSDLGSGFNIAMQDLDIRGAGNLLGGEQSGFISDIGFETYQRILDEALLELKNEQFKEQLSNKETDVEEDNDDIQFVSDCQIDTDLTLLFPDSYVENITERLQLYRDLDNINTEEELDKFKANLKDRFGEIPPRAIELLEVVKLRWIAIKLGIEKIVLKRKRLQVYFVSDPESYFFKSKYWHGIVAFLQSNVMKCELKEKNGRLSMIIQKVGSIHESIDILKRIYSSI